MRGGGTCLNAPDSNSGLKSYFKRFSLAPYGAAVSCHSEPLGERIQLMLKSMSEKFCLKSFKNFSIIHENKIKSWIATQNPSTANAVPLPLPREAALAMTERKAFILSPLPMGADCEQRLEAAQTCAAVTPYSASNQAEGARRAGEGLKRKCAFTLAEFFSLHPTCQRKHAFTLAEVLITLGIIGVVAAMTLPSLIAKHQEKAAVTQLKKSYSLLEQAFIMAVNDLGTVDNWCSQDDLYDNCSDIILANIKPYLNTVKDCPRYAGAVPKCFPVYKFFYNTTSWNSSYNIEGWGPSMILSDGSIFLIKAGNGDGYKSLWCTDVKNSSGYRYNGPCGYIYIDINGHKNPNQGGRDIFSFKIFKDGISPSGIMYDVIWTESFDSRCKREFLKTNGYHLVNCAAWVILNENMDYLHCDDLSWNGKTKCK